MDHSLRKMTQTITEQDFVIDMTEIFDINLEEPKIQDVENVVLQMRDVLGLNYLSEYVQQSQVKQIVHYALQESEIVSQIKN